MVGPILLGDALTRLVALAGGPPRRQAEHCRALAPGGLPSLLGLALSTAARPPAHRGRRALPRPPDGRCQPALGRPAHPRRAPQARHRHRRADGLPADAARPRKPPSQTWRAFLTNHVASLVSVDLFTVATATFRVLFVFVVLAHHRRRVLHFNVTERPSAAWTAQQLIQAFPGDTAPRHLLRDRDGILGLEFRRRAFGLGLLVTALDECAPTGGDVREASRHKQIRGGRARLPHVPRGCV